MFREGNGRRFVGLGLAAMFVLIGGAVFVAVLLARSSSPLGFGWGFFGLFWFFPLMWLFFLAFARPWRWGFWGSRRYGYGPYWYDGRNRDPAIDVLRERYARGELTKEQFDAMMKDLSQHQTF